MNTNDGWYWVLGRVDGDLYSYKTALASLASKKFTDVPGASSAVPIIGSVWADCRVRHAGAVEVDGSIFDSLCTLLSSPSRLQ